MFLTDLLKETIWSIAGNKVRSGLTILGIVIGIASVITMVAIGQGAQASIEKSIQSIGSNLIMIYPGASRSGGVSGGSGSGQTLTMEDAKAIASQIENVEAVSPEISRRYQVSAGGNNTNVQVIGAVPDYLIVRNLKIASGLFVTERQIQDNAKVAILGPTTRDDLFGVGADPIGKTVRIKNVDFEVIGVSEVKGTAGFGGDPDESVYIPISSASQYLAGSSGYVSSINITATSQDTMTAVQESITSLLMQRHGITDSTQLDFRLMNQADIISTASSATGIFTILLSSIAGISLLVGGIGIMNMMLTTVTERTREIGLRKAVGIKKFFIAAQFLAEAVMLTFLGGFLGIVLGFIATLIIKKLGAGSATEQLAFLSDVQISAFSVILAFSVSAIVGVFFGFYPALRAAKLSPIEALKYE